MRFSEHARKRGEIRRIKGPQVRLTLADPDEAYEDVEHESGIAVKSINERHLIVAYRETATATKIITLYYTTKFERPAESKTRRGAWRRRR